LRHATPPAANSETAGCIIDFDGRQAAQAAASQLYFGLYVRL
jgi:hypothetical protein